MDKLDGVTQSPCQDRSIVDELVDMIGYVLYVPTAISGPIVVYRKYHKGVSVGSMYKRFFLDFLGIRYPIFIMEKLLLNTIQTTCNFLIGWYLWGCGSRYEITLVMGFHYMV